MQIIACNTPYGQGGLGQHFAQVVEEAREQGQPVRYLCEEPQAHDKPIGQPLQVPFSNAILRYTPLRFSPGWQTYFINLLFDLAVSWKLDDPIEVYTGFAGESLYAFKKACSLGAKRLELHTPTAHVRKVHRLYEMAAMDYGIEASWLNEALVRKTLREYEMADVICVNSEYVRRSFLQEGVDADKLARIHLRPHPRYRAASERMDDEIFRVVYVGSVTEVKGIPVLLEAFSRFEAKAELKIVGGWSTRSMRRYMQAWMEHDARIRLAPGDPLPSLQRADVYVHPAYQDGFGYAPMEAMTCGVPVIVTEDTGMKECVEEGKNGYVVPTGDWKAILERMEHIHRHGLT